MLKKKIPPRVVPSRDEFYMGEAMMICAKSKDPRTQVGSRIVSANNEPLGSGYNGPPAEIDDNEINWDRPDKYQYIIHSEDNAIKHSPKRAMRGATIYVTAPPCRACMLDIVKAGIKRVVFFRPRNTDAGSMINSEEWAATEDIARRGGVKLEEFQGNLNWIRDHVAKLEQLGVFNGR